MKAGDVVKVKVLDVDLARRRISLTLRLDDVPGAERERGGDRRDAPNRPDRGSSGRGRKSPSAGGRGAGQAPAAGYNTALADAFARAKKPNDSR